MPLTTPSMMMIILELTPFHGVKLNLDDLEPLAIVLSMDFII